jgi:RHS repeat-associated protein
MHLASSPVFPEPPPAAMRLRGEKPHQGVRSKNPALHLGQSVCNSTVAIGMRAGLALEGVGSRCSAEQYDSDLGLYYLRARYYNPVTGRFLSRDPADGCIWHPISQQKYLYAGSDPVNGVDPSGRDTLVDYSRLFVIAAAVTTVSTYVQMTHTMAPGQLQGLGIEINCMFNTDASKLGAEVGWALAGGDGEIIQVGPCSWTFSRRKKQSDPVPRPADTHPGPNPNTPNGCGPCPPDIPAWPAPGSGHGGVGVHYHWYTWDQYPYPDCRCVPHRRSGPTPP